MRPRSRAWQRPNCRTSCPIWRPSLSAPEIRLVVFDWAGTTVDHGCFAPVVPFIEALARAGVTVTPRQARGPMGLAKKDHLRALLQIAEVAEQWRLVHGRPWTEADVDEVYQQH